MVSVCQSLYHRSSPGALVVMEENQPLHYSPDHPQVFLYRLVGILVYNWSCCFVCLYIACCHDLRPEYFVEGLEQCDRLLEPAVHGAFRQAFQPKVTVLLDLAVVGHMVLILLQQDLGEQACPSYPLINRQQGHGSHQYTAHTLGSDCGIILQAPLLANNLLDVQHSRLVLNNARDLLPDLLVKRLVKILRLEYELLQYGQVLRHETVLPFLPALLPGHDNLLHSLVAGLIGLLHLF